MLKNRRTRRWLKNRVERWGKNRRVVPSPIKVQYVIAHRTDKKWYTPVVIIDPKRTMMISSNGTEMFLPCWIFSTASGYIDQRIVEETGETEVVLTVSGKVRLRFRNIPEDRN